MAHEWTIQARGRGTGRHRDAGDPVGRGSENPPVRAPQERFPAKVGLRTSLQRNIEVGARVERPGPDVPAGTPTVSDPSDRAASGHCETR